METPQTIPSPASAQAVADEQRVPTNWLVQQAVLGRVPSLRIGELLYFDRIAVGEALLRMARVGTRFPRRGSADPITPSPTEEVGRG